MPDIDIKSEGAGGIDEKHRIDQLTAQKFDVEVDEDSTEISISGRSPQGEAHESQES